MAELVLRGVSKTYPGRVEAVRQLDLEVDDGELVTLVGPSGCGKTTTLRLIAGLETPTSGEIWIGGRLVNEAPPSERDIAMMFQDFALYPHLSVYKNMALGLELRYGRGWLGRFIGRVTRSERPRSRAVERREIRSQVELAAGVLGIQHLLNRKPRQLSGGERQRVALGRAIVRRPAAFLLDEPLSQLDLGLRVAMRRELRELHERQSVATLYVTHDQAEALTLGDRVAVMEAGEIQQIGMPEQVYRKPANRLVAAFLGSPPMNFGQVDVEEREGRAEVVGGATRLPLRASARWSEARRSVTLGVRPEDLTLTVIAADALVEGRITRSETLGDTSLVHVDLFPGQAPWVCKTRSFARYACGDLVGVHWEADREHWFDVESGARLA